MTPLLGIGKSTALDDEVKYVEWEDHRGERMRTGDFDEYIIMQSTGLKDKNGKEIFEGDIVLAHWQHDLSEREYLIKHSLTVVEFGKILSSCDDCEESERYVMGWGIRGKEYTGGQLRQLIVAPDNDPEYEIVGNLYQNPELLT